MNQQQFIDGAQNQILSTDRNSITLMEYKDSVIVRGFISEANNDFSQVISDYLLVNDIMIDKLATCVKLIRKFGLSNNSVKTAHHHQDSLRKQYEIFKRIIECIELIKIGELEEIATEQLLDEVSSLKK